jgi:hypothetical protein
VSSHPLADRGRIDRRGVLRGGAGLLATGAGLGCVAAQTESPRFRGVQVDTRPLAAIGGGPSAGLIQRLLSTELSTAFADRLAPGDSKAPVLVARIDHLFLSAFADAPSPGYDALGNMDQMDGAGLVLSGRQIVSTTPLRVSLPASYSGTSYLPDIDQRRIASLCMSFASWLNREIA